MSLIRKLSASSESFNQELIELLAYDASVDHNIETTTIEVINKIKNDGDKALIDYTNKFDNVNAKSMQDLSISLEQCQTALKNLDPQTRTALEQAANRIRSYHEHQKTESWTYTEEDGTQLGQKVTPLDSVGLYVPGGKAAYPSSVLMNAIPAKVAGVENLVMVTPTPNGEINPLVLAAAAIANVNQVWAIGGAQAVAALAYGTDTITAVDKIVGPGNAYVATAKKHVFGTVGIDMIAGPSEILIIADNTASPTWVAMDLFSQAEHDELAQAILLCPDQNFIDQVHVEIERLLPTMSRSEIIATSLKNRGALIKVDSLEQACEISNQIAPEHLEIATENAEELLDLIRHAGAIFLGHNSSEALGDYCAGPNHVLPTARTARFSSPLGVYDFQKRSSVINISADGAKKLAPIAATLAQGEGLQAHALSAQYRIKP